MNANLVTKAERESLLAAIESGKVSEWEKANAVDWSSPRGSEFISSLNGIAIQARCDDGPYVSFHGPHSLTERLNCNWHGFEFVGCVFNVPNNERTFSKCTFRSCVFQRVGVISHNTAHISFEACSQVIQCTFSATPYISTNHANFSFCQFDFSGDFRLECTNTEFRCCTLIVGTITDSVLHFTIFDSCKLRPRRIQRPTWSEVSFSDTLLDSDTVFSDAIFDNISIDDRFLESLGPKRGSLPESDVAKFRLHSPRTEIRLLFAGWRGTAHWILGGLFLMPYLIFAIEKFWGPLPAFPEVESTLRVVADAATQEQLLSELAAESQRTPAPKKVLFGTALWSFIQFGHAPEPDRNCMLALWRVTTFAFFSLYNVCRFALLLKVKSLEHARVVLGYWPLFSFTDPIHPKYLTLRWSRVLAFVQYGMLVAAACAIAQFIELLNKPVLP